jgi:hypothetical protein
MGSQGAVLAIPMPMLIMVDTNGFVLERWGYKNIHNAVKIMLYEGHDKYDQLATQLDAIKQELKEICDGLGLEMHGAIYVFKLVIGSWLVNRVESLGMLGQHLLSFVSFAKCPATTSTSPQPTTIARA